MKTRHAIIHDPVFDVEYYIQRGGTLQSAVDRFAKLSAVPTWEQFEDKYRRGCFISHGARRGGGIWLSPDAGTNAVTHEVHHAVSHLFRGMEAKDLEQINEMFAYYSGWLAAQVVKKLFK